LFLYQIALMFQSFLFPVPWAVFLSHITYSGSRAIDRPLKFSRVNMVFLQRA
jgi:hypothetical protein